MDVPFEASSTAGASNSIETGIAARAAILSEANGQFSIDDVILQKPREDEILVKIVGTGICHTDVVCKGAFPVPLPIVLGHEGSGVVEAVGSRVTKVKPGDHVVLTFNSCGSCPNCADSNPAYCHNFLPLNFAGLRLSDGSSPISKNGQMVHAVFFGQSSFASHVIAREENTVLVSKSAPLEILGPLGCGIQTGAGAILNSLKVRPGNSVVIFGAGAVGLSAVMAAKVAEAKTIIVVEPNMERRNLALELGATSAIDPNSEMDLIKVIKDAGGGGVNFALDTSGHPAVIGVAIETLLQNGMLGLVGMPPPDATLPVNIMSMFARGVGIKAIIEGDSEPHEFIPRLIQYYLDGRFPFDRLMTRFPFDKINEAFDATTSGKAIKPLLIAE
jgi:aryl-alcohol dehydrogenase/geraniol dehydrogenase (NAD+)